jgi:hypothetical protein
MRSIMGSLPQPTFARVGFNTRTIAINRYRDQLSFEFQKPRRPPRPFPLEDNTGKNPAPLWTGPVEEEKKLLSLKMIKH